MNVKEVLMEIIARLQPLVPLINESNEPNRYDAALSIQRLLVSVAGIEDDHDYGLYEVEPAPLSAAAMRELLGERMVMVDLSTSEFKAGLHTTTPTTAPAELAQPFVAAAEDALVIRPPHAICIGRGMRQINAERYRQIYEKDYNATHDDAHKDRELLKGALWFLAHAVYGRVPAAATIPWPFDDLGPHGPLPSSEAAMAAAGAMIAAEFDRLGRAEIPDFDDDIPF